MTNGAKKSEDMETLLYLKRDFKATSTDMKLTAVGNPPSKPDARQVSLTK